MSSFRDRRAENRIRRGVKRALERLIYDVSDSNRQERYKAERVLRSQDALEDFIDALLDEFEPTYEGPLADFAKAILQWLAENPDIWLPILIDLII